MAITKNRVSHTDAHACIPWSVQFICNFMKWSFRSGLWYILTLSTIYMPVSTCVVRRSSLKHNTLFDFGTYNRKKNWIQLQCTDWQIVLRIAELIFCTFKTKCVSFHTNSLFFSRSQFPTSNVQSFDFAITAKCAWNIDRKRMSFVFRMSHQERLPCIGRINSMLFPLPIASGNQLRKDKAKLKIQRSRSENIDKANEKKQLCSIGVRVRGSR